MAAEWLAIHPETPQPRLLRRALDRLQADGVIVYPTDSCYALGCALGNKAGAERLGRIRQFGRHHLYTLLCRDLAQVARYARFDNAQFRWLKRLLPGPYTIVLRASAEAPRRLLHEKRRTLGIRISTDPVARALVGALEEPLLSCTLILPPDAAPVAAPEAERRRLQGIVDLVLDAGDRGTDPTTLVDLEQDPPQVLRAGKGDLAPFLPEGATEPL